MFRNKIVKALRVPPGRKVDLDDYDPGLDVIPELKSYDKDDLKALASESLKANSEELAAAQELLYASDVYSVLIILQAMDAAGKDGTIKHVMSGVNPQGCQVFAFNSPRTRSSTTTAATAPYATSCAPRASRGAWAR
jgi:polyphosphate kinase 2 (PPK2 family)